MPTGIRVAARTQRCDSSRGPGASSAGRNVTAFAENVSAGDLFGSLEPLTLAQFLARRALLALGRRRRRRRFRGLRGRRGCRVRNRGPFLLRLVLRRDVVELVQAAASHEARRAEGRQYRPRSAIRAHHMLPGASRFARGASNNRTISGTHWPRKSRKASWKASWYEPSVQMSVVTFPIPLNLRFILLGSRVTEMVASTTAYTSPAQMPTSGSRKNWWISTRTKFGEPLPTLKPARPSSAASACCTIWSGFGSVKMLA